MTDALPTNQLRTKRESALSLDREPFNRPGMPAFGIDVGGWFVEHPDGQTTDVSVLQVTLSAGRFPVFRATRELIQQLAQELAESVYRPSTGSGRLVAPATDDQTPSRVLRDAARLIAQLAEELEDAENSRANLLVR